MEKVDKKMWEEEFFGKICQRKIGSAEIHRKLFHQGEYLDKFILTISVT